MNEELGLKLQADLDGELSSGERKEVETLLARDPELRALKAELSFVTRSLKDSDPVMQVPASREFYFSQIERRIAASESEMRTSSVGPGSRFGGWLRQALLPLSGVAAACLMLVLGLREGPLPALSFHEETESPLDETAAVTFRSESEKVTIVWVYDRQLASVDTTLDH